MLPNEFKEQQSLLFRLCCQVILTDIDERHSETKAKSKQKADKHNLSFRCFNVIKSMVVHQQALKNTKKLTTSSTTLQGEIMPYSYAYGRMQKVMAVDLDSIFAVAHKSTSSYHKAVGISSMLPLAGKKVSHLGLPTRLLSIASLIDQNSSTEYGAHNIWPLFAPAFRNGYL